MNEDFHLGRLIREELDRQERTVKWLAKQINCERSTCYYIFDRKFIDIPLLIKLCAALRHNFFVELSAYTDTVLLQGVQNISTQVSKKIQQ